MVTCQICRAVKKLKISLLILSLMKRMLINPAEEPKSMQGQFKRSNCSDSSQQSVLRDEGKNRERT